MFGFRQGECVWTVTVTSQKLTQAYCNIKMNIFLRHLAQSFQFKIANKTF